MNARILQVVFFAALVAGVNAQSTERVSVASDGTQGTAHSQGAVISADGRYVAFDGSFNLVPGFSSCIYRHDRQTHQTAVVDVNYDGSSAAAFNSGEQTLSADGRFVAFASIADHLVLGDTNLASDIFVRDMSAGSTTRVNMGVGGVQSNANSYGPAISADGRFVAYWSYATNLVANYPYDHPTNHSSVYLYDAQTGLTTCVSTDTAGVPVPDQSTWLALSADGRWIAFRSKASNLVPGDTNAVADVFERDLLTGQTIRVNVSSSGGQSDAAASDARPAISADGRYVAFYSSASNLVPGDTNGWEDIFVHDRLTGQTIRASVDSSGAQSNHGSGSPALSADGRFVAFDSFAWNLVPGDSNSATDVFLHDLRTGSTTCLSVDPNGLPASGPTANGSCFAPSISADGRYVAFDGWASNLVPGDTNGVKDCFVRDRLGFDPPVSYCSGDGSGTACPCGNAGASGNGCASSIHPLGASLSGDGRPSVVADSFVLLGTDTSNSVVTYFQGTDSVNAGAGVVFGDGLRCAGGSVIRLAAVLATNGTSQYPQAGDAPISVQGMIGGAGGRRYYQIWYRNADPTFCTASTFNLTNALSVPWAP